MRENRQTANKKLYREDVLQMLFTDSDSEGEYCLLEMTIGRLMIALLPVHLCSTMVPPCKARVFTKHKQVIISTLCPTRMGVAGVNVVVVSIGESCCSLSATGSVLLMIGQIASIVLIAHTQRAVPCNERYHTLRAGVKGGLGGA